MLAGVAFTSRETIHLAARWAYYLACRRRAEGGRSGRHLDIAIGRRAGGLTALLRPRARVKTNRVRDSLPGGQIRVRPPGSRTSPASPTA